jgi:hypothetical protein
LDYDCVNFLRQNFNNYIVELFLKIPEGNSEYGLICKLEEIYPKFHIHGLTTHEILYPFDPHNSAHSRGDGKLFICTHC